MDKIEKVRFSVKDMSMETGLSRRLVLRLIGNHFINTAEIKSVQGGRGVFLSKKQLQKLKNIIAENDRYKIIRKHQQKLGILKTRFNKLSVKLQAVGLEIKNIESSL